MRPVDYRKLATERNNPATASLDLMSAEHVLRTMNREDRKVLFAVQKQIGRIALGVKAIVRALRCGGRIFFVGAGTSGRLGVLEAAELPPTFNVPSSLATALMAGGKQAVFRSKEGAEDDAADARARVRQQVRKNDVVIGIAASGVTPFVRAALGEARRTEAGTILVTCNKVRVPEAQVAIVLEVGPEVIAGSTRLKSATATKMVLNMMSVAAMVQMGKVYGNRMVDLQPKSKKLVERGVRLVEELAGVPRRDAERYFKAAGRNVKTAVLMAARNLDLKRASALLKSHRGFLRAALSGK